MKLYEAKLIELKYKYLVEFASVAIWDGAFTVGRVLHYQFNLYDRCRSIRRRQWHPTPVLLPGKSHGQGSLVGCSPWGLEESDTTERLHFPFSLSCIGEGNGNPLQCSCLENPRDGGAWWAAVYGVAQSQIRRKRLSSSSRSIMLTFFSCMSLGSFAVQSIIPFHLSYQVCVINL